MILMGYSGAQGTLIYEKNLKSKISCQTPFKLGIGLGRCVSTFCVVFLKHKTTQWRSVGRAPNHLNCLIRIHIRRTDPEAEPGVNILSHSSGVSGVHIGLF